MLKLNKSLLGGSIILLIAFNIYNAINFFFQFSMARMLTIEDYGILATLYSIIYILAIFSESIQTVIMKYSSSEKNSGRIKNLIKRSINKSLTIFFLMFIIYLIISIPLSYFLEITYPLLALNGLIIFSAIIIPVNRGVMLGKKMFKPLAANLLVEAISKILFAIVLVFMGWRVYGAVTATIISSTLAFLFSFHPLRQILKSKEEISKAEGIYKYTLPVFFITLIITLFYSIDIIIAKIVFDSSTAGIYAIASILSKTIFWGTAPISKAMFPMSSENNSNIKKRRSILVNSFIILSVCIILALLIFFIFPEILIKIFSGKSISEAASIIIYLGISLSILSFANLILLYKISIGKTGRFYYLSFFIIIESVLLFYFSSNLVQFSIAFLFSSIIFLIGSIFVLKEKK